MKQKVSPLFLLLVVIIWLRVEVLLILLIIWSKELGKNLPT